MCFGGRALFPSPPSRGEREGPTPEAWEGEVGLAAGALESPTSPRPSPPPNGLWRAERESPVAAARSVLTIQLGGRRCAQGRAISNKAAARSSRASPKCGPISCSPIGSPSLVQPQGRVTAGLPDKLNGKV